MRYTLQITFLTGNKWWFTIGLYKGYFQRSPWSTSYPESIDSWKLVICQYFDGNQPGFGHFSLWYCFCCCSCCYFCCCFASFSCFFCLMFWSEDLAMLHLSVSRFFGHITEKGVGVDPYLCILKLPLKHLLPMTIERKTIFWLWKGYHDESLQKYGIYSIYIIPFSASFLHYPFRGYSGYPKSWRTFLDWS